MSAESANVVIPFDTRRQRPLPVHECAGCMKLEAEKQALASQTEAMAVDIANYEKQGRKDRRRISMLEQEVERILRGPDNPDHKLAERMFEFWREQNGKSKRVVFDVAREKAILQALKILEKGWGEDAPKALAAAIIGNARLHHTDPRTGVKYTEIKMICRDAEMLDKNIGRYFAYMEQTGQAPAIEPLEEE